MGEKYKVLRWNEQRECYEVICLDKDFPDVLRALIEEGKRKGWGCFYGCRVNLKVKDGWKFIKVERVSGHDFGLILTPPQEPPDQGEKGSFADVGENTDCGHDVYEEEEEPPPPSGDRTCGTCAIDYRTCYLPLRRYGICEGWQPKAPATMKGAVR